jgi:hypothetical protein
MLICQSFAYAGQVESYGGAWIRVVSTVRRRPKTADVSGEAGHFVNTSVRHPPADPPRARGSTAHNVDVVPHDFNRLAAMAAVGHLVRHRPAPSMS